MKGKEITKEEWTVLFGSFEFSYQIPGLIRKCIKNSYQPFLVAKSMNEIIRETRDLHKARKEIIKKFFS